MKMLFVLLALILLAQPANAQFSTHWVTVCSPGYHEKIEGELTVCVKDVPVPQGHLECTAPEQWNETKHQCEATGPLKVTDSVYYSIMCERGFHRTTDQGCIRDTLKGATGAQKIVYSLACIPGYHKNAQQTCDRDTPKDLDCQDRGNGYIECKPFLNNACPKGWDWSTDRNGKAETCYWPPMITDNIIYQPAAQFPVNPVGNFAQSCAEQHKAIRGDGTCGEVTPPAEIAGLAWTEFVVLLLASTVMGPIVTLFLVKVTPNKGRRRA